MNCNNRSKSGFPIIVEYDLFMTSSGHFVKYIHVAPTYGRRFTALIPV